MIEDRLYEAVQELPVPAVSFTAVKERAARQKNVSRFQFIQHRRIAGLFAGVFLLAGCTVIAATTEVDYGAWATPSSRRSKRRTSPRSCIRKIPPRRVLPPPPKSPASRSRPPWV